MGLIIRLGVYVIVHFLFEHCLAVFYSRSSSNSKHRVMSGKWTMTTERELSTWATWFYDIQELATQTAWFCDTRTPSPTDECRNQTGSQISHDHAHALRQCRPLPTQRTSTTQASRDCGVTVNSMDRPSPVITWYGLYHWTAQTHRMLRRKLLASGLLALFVVLAPFVRVQ